MSAFTPGPWEADETHFKRQLTDFWGQLVSPKSGNHFVAIVPGRDSSSTADANLIAAAPDLYAALERAVNMLSTHRSYLPEADAALAKARGES